MNADDFAAELARSRACAAAREWSAGKTAQEAWTTCDDVNWMHWWVHHVIGLYGPNRILTIDAATCPCRRYRNVETLRAAYPRIPLTADAILRSVATGLAPQPEP